MNQEAEEGKETNSSLDDQIVENEKSESWASPHHLKRFRLTVFCQMWYLEENLACTKNARDYCKKGPGM